MKDGSRASAVIQRVRAMVRKAPPQMSPIDINETILEIVALTHAEAEGRRITVETELSNQLPPVFGDRIQVQQGSSIWSSTLLRPPATVPPGNEGS